MYSVIKADEIINIPNRMSLDRGIVFGLGWSLDISILVGTAVVAYCCCSLVIS
jgi:hypothetical protein